MSNVYSKRLYGPAQPPPSTAPAVFYTCPVGKVCVVKSVVLLARTSTAVLGVILSINSALVGTNRFFLLEAPLGKGAIQELRAVLNAGETLEGYGTTALACTVSIFGYELG